MIMNDLKFEFKVPHLEKKYAITPFSDAELREIMGSFTLEQQLAIIQCNSSEWISVKDELPMGVHYDCSCSDDPFLVCSLDSKEAPSLLYGIAHFKNGSWEILGNKGAHRCTGFYEMTSEMITHWREFPDQP